MTKSASGRTREKDWYNGTNGTDGKTERKPSKPMPVFVRCELSELQREHVRTQQFTWDDCVENIVALVEGGYKVSLGEDAYNSCFACWITAPPKDSPNSGFILQGRGPTVLGAVAVALYKHFTVLEGNWLVLASKSHEEPWG